MTELITSAFAVFDKASGDLLHFAPEHLAQETESTSVTPLPADFDERFHRWSSEQRQVTVDVNAMRDVAMATIKSVADAKKMQRLTTGEAKPTEYAAKSAEVALWDTLSTSGTVVNAIAANVVRARFPWACADADGRGDQPADAIERFRQGILGAGLPAIAAEEGRVCEELRTAQTAAAIVAATDGATWPE